MIICSWNVRGLIDPNKTRELKSFLSVNKVDVIAILETRVRENNNSKIQQKLGGGWNWHCNSSCNPRGRIWLVHGELVDSKGVSMCLITFVYGLHTVETRKALWSALSGIADMVPSSPWLVLGDFNAVLASHDRTNGTSGLGDSRVPSRIDIALENGCWMLKYGHLAVDYLNPSISDHSPLLLKFGDDHREGGRPFKFFNFLLKTLHKEEFAGISMRIQKAQQELEEVQSQLGTDPTNFLLQVDEKVYTEKLRKWLSVEESALKQKSRIQWLADGDSNSKFFYASVKQRRNVNRISLLYTDQGHKIVDPGEITLKIQKFYVTLLGTSATHLSKPDLPTLRSGSRLSRDATLSLCVPVTNAEIDMALKSIDDNKAPGLDGFNVVFFKKACVGEYS
ncbi:uncharacterized protein [Spinacia oleracea]|uniref:Endonuclease/exonuclease/phosphatase domain-containing protein n=1 Tax=Spinacia oleracea TaxID=3562 RepID=A0ABM3R7P0_SPIOL|nr:uncharacterized protein LOC110803502 [Spinacia oleracea]